LRSLGVTTLSVRVFDDIAPLDLGAIGCIITSQAEAPARVHAMAQNAGWRLIAIPDGAFEGAAQRPIPPPPGAAAPAGGHILLTSGTTGSYKKVLIDPVSEAMNIPRRSAIFGISAASVINLFDFAAWTSAGYNMAVCAWGVGGAVQIHQGADKHRSLASGEATHAELHPELLKELLAAPADALRRNPQMMLIVISGALPKALWEETRERLTPRIHTCISSTETGPFTLTLIETADDLRWHRVHPSRSVEIVDDAGAPVAQGQLGRMRVRLVDKVSGYLGDAETTARFFADGCFYTGDLAAFRPDGRLSLQGRITEVINVDGNKVAAAPVEEALQDALGAEGVCVFSMQGADAAEEVHVAIEARRPIDRAELTAIVRHQLQGFDKAHVHFVKALPRSPAGKIQRLALRAMVMGAKG
jgi:acyl-coenzyme A synthetase/AMP-(fatty) acid ligase